MCSFLSFSDESDESSRIAAAGAVEIGAAGGGIGHLHCRAKNPLSALVAGVHLLGSTTLGRFATPGGVTGDGQGVASQ
jgi:hypothetical protein